MRLRRNNIIYPGVIVSLSGWNLASRGSGVMGIRNTLNGSWFSVCTSGGIATSLTNVRRIRKGVGLMRR
jgi:hypothetical protein